MRINLRSLEYQYPGNPPLFTNVNWNLENGGFYGIVGPSGSGKSTLLSIIAGKQTPTAGSVTREGINSLFWVLQSSFGVPQRSALDHVSLPLLAKGIHPKTADAAALDLLSRFALDHLAHQPYATLSGGEASRLMLARAVAVSPDLYLVDEPTAELDRRTAAQVNSVLRELINDGGIVIVATHDPTTRQVCDNVLDLSNSANNGEMP
ncbi:MAG: ATP-binding cassette domain-containing protein [Bifidobacteriaceae bacterium]|jgi:putative ABC transport system ATP-binding protein/lipoprotein-releasing system ATP-binding protein|nr:ATP-binding cassette domain-containing protein [Bifidobacteriaceae bacterium]